MSAPNHPLTAVIKGAGPSGLAAAIALSQSGLDVIAVDKRPQRPEGQGRQNMVAIRPEALHQLDLLGAYEHIDRASMLTPITSAATMNELDGSCFVWPLDTQVRYPRVCERGEPGDGGRGAYTPPVQIDQQVPSSFVTLGELEDVLTRVAVGRGVRVVYEATVHLQESCEDGTYSATVRPVSERAQSEEAIQHPTLIVCASGKGDTSLSAELNFKRRIGNRLDDDILPLLGSRELRLGAENEMESQKFCVFGVRTPTAEMGVLKHVVRKYGTDVPQPVVEIEMRHAEASHCLLQLPREFPDGDIAKLEQYVVDRVNERLGTAFSSAEEMRTKGGLVWGDPLVPVVVETAIAPKFVFGNNVILVGDAGMSCSPSSGLGVDVGLTHDVQAVRALAKGLIESNSVADAEEATTTKAKALVSFNLTKAQGAVMWSKGSRWFYITNDEADEIVRQSNGLL